MKLFHCLGVLILLATVTSQGARLGDPAPPILVNEMIKGAPVDLAAGKGKQIFIVEFWATWCPPCRETIPHLTKLQKKFRDKGVTIIGISDESAEDVKPFVRKMGRAMDYAVAVDPDHRTYATYMDAYARENIPTAFLVDKEGRVVWVGFPLEGMDEALEKIIAGTYDLAAVQKEVADQEARQQRLMQLNLTFGKYLQLADTDDKQNAAAESVKLLEIAGSDAEMLSNIAWTLLTSSSIKHRDFPLALRVATLGMKASDGKNLSVLDTYARALFESGQVDEAIQQQKKAISLTSDRKIKSALESSLKAYKAKRPKN